MKKILLLIAMVVGGFTLTSCSNDDDNVTSISKEQIEENKKKGEDFLAENAKKEGVITTESGLQYMVLREGDGESPNSKDVVKCHYEGRLIDNRIFDSSYNRNAPSEFALNQVIKG
jgi:FKBP-type peptidyl-prolyl cis-trans isomerase FklB